MKLHWHSWEALTEAFTSDYRCTRCGLLWEFQWGREPGLWPSLRKTL